MAVLKILALGTHQIEEGRVQSADGAIQARFLYLEIAPGPLEQSLKASKPPQFQTEFSVTAVFRVRIVDPLDAATVGGMG